MTDPATMMALGTIGGSLLGAVMSGRSAQPTDITLPTPAPPVQSPTGTQSSTGAQANTTQGPSFLAAAAAPTAGQLGNKTLLGQ